MNHPDVVVVNEKDEVVGTMPRVQAHKDGTPHRIAVVYVRNPAGQIVVQTRMGGRLDHSAAGHVDPGESYIDTARRELEEELGIRNIELVSIGKGVSKDVLKEVKCTHVFEVFVCTGEPGELQADEVRSIAWMDPVHVLKEMHDNQNDDTFAGGFRASLPIYLNFLGK